MGYFDDGNTKKMAMPLYFMRLPNLTYIECIVNVQPKNVTNERNSIFSYFFRKLHQNRNQLVKRNRSIICHLSKSLDSCVSKTLFSI